MIEPLEIHLATFVQVNHDRGLPKVFRTYFSAASETSRIIEWDSTR
jgi:hypothetical protein